MCVCVCVPIHSDLLLLLLLAVLHTEIRLMFACVGEVDSGPVSPADSCLGIEVRFTAAQACFAHLTCKPCADERRSAAIAGADDDAYHAWHQEARNGPEPHLTGTG